MVLKVPTFRCSAARRGRRWLTVPTEPGDSGGPDHVRTDDGHNTGLPEGVRERQPRPDPRVRPYAGLET